MPELPEVETIRLGLIPVLEGKILEEIAVYRDQLRYPLPPLFSERLKGQKVNRLERRAKYLWLHIENSQTLVIHLGMSGRFKIEEASLYALQKHDHVVFYNNAGQVIAYNDPRRFGLMDLIPTATLKDHPLFRHLGAEPLETTFTPEAFYQLLRKRQQSIKSTLMDQRFIVGIGNIYANEGLWVSQIHPFRPSNSLTYPEAETLLDNLRTVLKKAILAGGSTLKDHLQPDGKLGYFQNQFSVYGRPLAPCPRQTCQGFIKKYTQDGRSTFACDSCQL